MARPRGRPPTGDRPKDTMIRIRSDSDLKRRFKVFVVKQGFDSASNALEYLLDCVEQPKETRKIEGTRKADR